MPESSPAVSIGMPVYNMARTIREAVTSLLNQTFTDFELLIGDNASTDGTEALCRQMAESDARIRYVRHERNIGAGGTDGNFYFVFSHTTAPLFMWAAADDRWHPRFLEVAVDALARHPEAVTAFSNVEVIDGARRDWKHHLARLSGGGRLRRVARYAFLRDDSGKANLIGGLHRRKNLQRCCYGMSHGNLWGADYLVAAEMLLEGSAQIADEVLFYKRFAADADGAKWSLFGYPYSDLRLCWGYVAATRQLCGLPFSLLLVPVAAGKYVRDMMFWTSLVGRAAMRRLLGRRAAPAVK